MAADQTPSEVFVTQPAPLEGPGLSYGTPQAFDAAIKARIAVAAEDSVHSIAELRRQFGYDRLLSRLFTTQPDRWVLKGGASLLARIPRQARHSQDIDLYHLGEAEAATDDLVAAGDVDLGDYFSFDIEKTSDLTGVHPGVRYRITAYLGAKVFAEFGVDAVVATNMTGTPDTVPNLAPIAIDGLATAAYRAYPVVDHIADKHAAMIDTYHDGKPSSRYRDLVDLVLLATTQHFTAADLHTALVAEYAHRSLDMPTDVALPSLDWIAGYATEANGVPDLTFRTADEALAVVKKLIDPVLAGRVTGTWDPDAVAWTED